MSFEIKPEELHPGKLVHYKEDGFKSTLPQNGIVKSFCPDPYYVWVVYYFPRCSSCKCEEIGPCGKYLDFTAQRTFIGDLHEGWVDSEGRNILHRELVQLKQFGLLDRLK